jgi:hypothetical protein
MSRRKKRSAQSRESSLPARVGAVPPSRRRLPEPNPPRPSRLLLGIMAAVLLVWLGVLVYMAATSVKWPGPPGHVRLKHNLLPGWYHARPMGYRISLASFPAGGKARVTDTP